MKGQLHEVYEYLLDFEMIFLVHVFWSDFLANFLFSVTFQYKHTSKSKLSLQATSLSRSLKY